MSGEKRKYVRSQKLLLKQNVVFMAESDSRLQEERVQYERPAPDVGQSLNGGISSPGAARGFLQRKMPDPRLQSRPVVRLERVKINSRIWNPAPPAPEEIKHGKLPRLHLKVGGDEDRCSAAPAGYSLIPFGSDRKKTIASEGELCHDGRREEAVKYARCHAAESDRRDRQGRRHAMGSTSERSIPTRTLSSAPVTRGTPTLLECPECGRKFVFSYNLKCHMRSHAESTRVLCNMTNDTQDLPQDGKSDVKTVTKKRRKWSKIPRSHKTVRPFVCTKCERRFHRGVGLSAHRRVHSGRRSVCPRCGKSFSYRAILLAHQWLHTGRKPFRCPRCSESFLQWSHLQQHQKVLSHQTLHTGASAFTCTRCGKGFRMKVHLKLHQAAHAGMRSFECTECGRRFGQRRRLVWHQLIHTGERPYVCTQCGQSFRWKRNLNAHLQVHSPESFPCAECGRSFSHQALLRLHQLMHAKERPYVSTKHGSKRRRRPRRTRNRDTHRHDAFCTYTKWEKSFQPLREIYSHKAVVTVIAAPGGRSIAMR